MSEFLEKNPSPREWLYNAFAWIESKHKPKLKSNVNYNKIDWKHLDTLWNDFINENIDKYTFKFAKENIQNFKIIEINDIKILKQKKL